MALSHQIRQTVMCIVLDLTSVYSCTKIILNIRAKSLVTIIRIMLTAIQVEVVSNDMRHAALYDYSYYELYALFKPLILFYIVFRTVKKCP